MWYGCIREANITVWTQLLFIRRHASTRRHVCFVKQSLPIITALLLLIICGHQQSTSWVLRSVRLVFLSFQMRLLTIYRYAFLILSGSFSYEHSCFPFAQCWCPCSKAMHSLWRHEVLFWACWILFEGSSMYFRDLVNMLSKETRS